MDAAKDATLVKYLIPSLVTLFIEIEHTGGDVQFYDKFNVRHTIAVLLKHLSSQSRHAKQLDELVTNQPTVALRFVNSIIKDSTYLLDESLTKAAQYGTLQKEALALVGSRRAEHERTIAEHRKMFANSGSAGYAQCELALCVVGVQRRDQGVVPST